MLDTPFFFSKTYSTDEPVVESVDVEYEFSFSDDEFSELVLVIDEEAEPEDGYFVEFPLLVLPLTSNSLSNSQYCEQRHLF